MKKSFVWLSILCGMSVVVFMMIREFDVTAIHRFTMTPQAVLSLVVAVLLFCTENLMRTFRFQSLTHHRLSLRKCLRVNLLCEFTSAVTPSAVGGSSLMPVYLYREGITLGQSTFCTFATLLADETFLAVSSILLLCCCPSADLFGIPDTITGSIKWIFIISTALIALWALLLWILLIFRPKWISVMLWTVCKIGILKRFRRKVVKFSSDLTLAASEAKKHGWTFWLKILSMTAVAWMSRFAIVVAILAVFSVSSRLDIAWIRQWVIWMVATISPTPGGSGLAEMMFNIYYQDFIQDHVMVVFATILWRLIFYYSYLLLGMIFLPGLFHKTKSSSSEK